MYKYNARLIRVIDGSTIDANIDLGFGVFVKQRVRLFGIKCPDPKNKDDAIRAKGLAVKTRLIELIGSKFVIETILNKRGKFGRILGIVYIVDDAGNETNINEKLVSEGHAEKY